MYVPWGDTYDFKTLLQYLHFLLGLPAIIFFLSCIKDTAIILDVFTSVYL